MSLDPTKNSKTLDAAKTVVLTGDAVVGDVKSPKTFYKDDPETKLTGTLALTGDAVVGDVKAGKKFYKDDPATQLTGTMPTKAIVAANDLYEAGYHVGNAGGLDAIDPDLAPANIKQGVTIFGKVGTYVMTANLIESFHSASSTTSSTTWTAVSTQTIPATAKKVYLHCACAVGGDWDAGGSTAYARCLYNAVERCAATYSNASANGINGGRWSGNGIGSSASAVLQKKDKAGGGDARVSGGCQYVTLT